MENITREFKTSFHKKTPVQIMDKVFISCNGLNQKSFNAFIQKLSRTKTRVYYDRIVELVMESIRIEETNMILIKPKTLDNRCGVSVSIYSFSLVNS